MVENAGAIAGIVSAVLDVGKCYVLFNHKSNLRNLETEVGKLKLARGKVKGMVELLETKRKRLKRLLNVVSDVDSIVPEAETLINGRANVRCFNLGARYKLRRKASRKVEDISQLLKQQEAFGDRVSRPIIHEDTRLILNKDYLAFQSRSSTLEDVLKALKEAEVDIIGVHGMGGIGKTTLVKEVVRQAKADKRFDKVIFVEVTDTPNIEKIREEIADNLDLELDDKKTETGKANKLFARLKEVKTILIILDNIWDELDLEKLGIPVGENHKGCKLLLTARDRNVLDRMGSKSFSIDVLKEDEAWNLFRKMTGEVVDMRELQSLPNDVCKECGGLPIAIVTVARALKSKRQLSQWRKALQELRSPSPTEFKGVLKEAYSKIALSYNYLQGEEHKKVFLLCSIMTYDASISNLFKFVMGLNILEGNNLKIEEARDRLDALLHELKESCLLLDCSSSERFSMHDVVRDIAITISYKDHHVLTERNDVEDEWKNVDILKKCTTISLARSDIISKHWAEGLECPELEFFYMKYSSFKFPERFFSGMAKLKVLSLNFLPSPIILPIGLQTLCLDSSEIEEVAIIGELKKLKILSLRYCYNIKQLPGEISQLIQLRFLDLSNCANLHVITADVISSLVLLEELYMRGCPVLWAVGGPNVERNNASLEELLHLSCLTALEIDIEDEKILPKGFFSKKLERYSISVGDACHCDIEFIENKRSRRIKMKLNSSICLEELQGIKNVESLCLDKLQNIKNGLQELDNDGFSQLKYLHVKGCDKLTIPLSLPLFPLPILPQLKDLKWKIARM
ncbi:disease resistance protein At4g27190-like [Pistacia vera]|uniref:disease resistance protein At4g27190-like n=1 Tax=Pistacia vera TaxID=55513 RepID=UPI001263C6C5|nr:disease resistance protein At4g27190-like [Pistacia vera]